MFLAKTIYVIFLVLLAYFIAVASFYLLLNLVGFIESLRRARQCQEEDYPLLFLSSVTAGSLLCIL